MHGCKETNSAAPALSETEKATIAFMEIVVDNNISGKVSSALLKFFKLYKECDLPVDHRTLTKRYDSVLEALSSSRKASEIELGEQAMVLPLDVSKLPGYGPDSRASFIYYNLGDALMHLVQGTPSNEPFVLRRRDTVAIFGHRVYSEPHTGDAWLEAEKHCQHHHSMIASVLGVMFYEDETMVNTLPGRAYYPMVLSIANHSLGYRSSKAGKYVVGYLPVLQCPRGVTSSSQRRVFSEERLLVLNECWKLLVGQLRAWNKTGMLLQVHGRYRKLVPYLLLCV